MINLNKMVEAIWETSDLDQKRNLVRDMINASSAEKATKIKYLSMLPGLNSTRLDKLVSDYSLSGMGMKVI